MNITPPDIPTNINDADATTFIITSPQDAAEAPLWPVGALLDDRYPVLEIRGGQGRSGMGIVYIVSDGGQKRAVKTFQRRFSQRLPFIQRFIREARTWMALGTHPNIVQADRFDIINAIPYLFMEYVPADGAGRYSTADYVAKGPIPLDLALRFALQFCAGMLHATQAAPGLVHRDIKPENLLVAPGGTLKISDFGLAMCKAEAVTLAHLACGSGPATSQERLTQAGAIFGTPAYMAPEQFDNAAQTTPAADIYAFACCFCEWVTGRPPFEVRSTSSLGRIAEFQRKHAEAPPPRLRDRAPECPNKLDDLLHECLEKDPRRRLQDFQTLLERFLRIARDVAGSTVHPPPLNTCAHDRTPEAPSRSLALLDGYDQAIRMRNLREGQESSPYAFHLALASYFHCRADALEERRQLEKALRARTAESGYEAVRRLGDLLLAQNAIDEAESLIQTFLEHEPGALDRVLEPHVRRLCAQQRFDEALRCLDNAEASLRIRILRAYVLKTARRNHEFALILRHLLSELLERIESKINALSPVDRVGWALDGDADTLRAVLTLLHPECGADILDVVDSAIWPDLSGYPDFAPEMAWLSHTLGELAALNTEVSTPDRRKFSDAARLLGFPQRLQLQMERDEYWFWMQDAPSG